MDQKQMDDIISRGLTLSYDEKVYIARALSKVDGIDRVQKAKRNGIFEKVLIKKYTFCPNGPYGLHEECSDENYRTLIDRVRKQLGYEFFKSSEFQKMVYDEDAGHCIRCYEAAYVAFRWREEHVKKKHFKKIVKEALLSMKKNK